jgi:hypothetical protein
MTQFTCYTSDLNNFLNLRHPNEHFTNRESPVPPDLPPPPIRREAAACKRPAAATETDGDEMVAAACKRPAAAATETDGGEMVAANTESKRQKEAYLVNRRKFHSSATEEELQRELSLNSQAGDTGEGGEGLEDVHRIIQARIR